MGQMSATSTAGTGFVQHDSATSSDFQTAIQHMGQMSATSTAESVGAIEPVAARLVGASSTDDTATSSNFNTVLDNMDQLSATSDAHPALRQSTPARVRTSARTFGTKSTLDSFSQTSSANLTALQNLQASSPSSEMPARDSMASQRGGDASPYAPNPNPIQISATNTATSTDQLSLRGDEEFSSTSPDEPKMHSKVAQTIQVGGGDSMSSSYDDSSVANDLSIHDQNSLDNSYQQ
jgi:hypothetical protein